MNIHTWLIRHIQWPLMEAWKGNRIRTYLHDLGAWQNKSPAELELSQWQKLLKLLAHAVERVPAYRQFAPAFSGRVDEANVGAFLATLPVLTKQHFNAHRDEYLAQGVDRTALIENRTGGSTGEPTRFYLDRVTVEHFEAARWLGLSWHDIRIGDPSVMIWGSPIELNQTQSWRYRFKERWLKNRIIVPAYDLSHARLPADLRRIRSFRPAYLYGYASALALFAQLMLEKGETLGIPLKAVVSTAESLHPHQREVIAKAFGCPVVNEYGARDGGIIAYECRAGRMHLFTPNAVVEVVDLETKRPVAPGEKGLLLLTDLNNYAMPRLRYQLGDVVALSAEPCTCGLSFPVLDSIDGREDDIFISTNGHYVHGHYFNHVARNLDGIETFQIVQHAPDRVTLSLVNREGAFVQHDVETFVEAIRRALGDDVRVNFQFVDEIPPSPSGKRRYSIRECPL